VWFPQRADLRVGLCPDRLVTADSVDASRDPLVDLRALAKSTRVTLILSNHFVRYTVLPWSPALKSAHEWLALAKHSFSSTYGSVATRWRVMVSPNRTGAARVATAVDEELVQCIRAIPNVVSVRPYLMAAFNARRHALKNASAWFVIQEAGRLTVCLIAKGAWRAIRLRRAESEWQPTLADLLQRETLAGADRGAERVFLCCEDEPPRAAGRYLLEDVTLPRGIDPALRQRVMTLH